MFAVCASKISHRGLHCRTHRLPSAVFASSCLAYAYRSSCHTFNLFPSLSFVEYACGCLASFIEHFIAVLTAYRLPVPLMSSSVYVENVSQRKTCHTIVLLFALLCYRVHSSCVAYSRLSSYPRFDLCPSLCCVKLACPCLNFAIERIIVSRDGRVWSRVSSLRARRAHEGKDATRKCKKRDQGIVTS